MPNLILTYRCNKECSYCFINSKKSSPLLTLPYLKARIPFLRTFDHDAINLVGGEPTLNPDYIEILRILLKEGFEVTTFTNGMLSSGLIMALQNMNDGEFTFCVNRTDPRLADGIVELYRRLGHRVQLGLTLFESQQSMTHIHNEILTYRLKKHIRIGIALPAAANNENKYIVPEDYTEISPVLFEFIRQGIESGIRVSFDCGFPYCFFKKDQREYLEKHDIEFASNCGIIPDIIPDFTVIPCFPLANFRQKISETSHWDDVKKGFDKMLAKVSFQPLFLECRDCEPLIRGKCNGGCRGLRMI